LKKTWSDEKKTWAVHWIGATGFLFGLVLCFTNLWFPLPFFEVEALSARLAIVGSALIVVGPLLFILTVHPRQTTHWKRDLLVIVGLQIICFVSSLAYFWNTRPAALLFMAGDVFVLKKQDIIGGIETNKFGPVKYVIKRDKIKGLESKEIFESKNWSEMTSEQYKKSSSWSLDLFEKDKLALNHFGEGIRVFAAYTSNERFWLVLGGNGEYLGVLKGVPAPQKIF
jgi:hypothetical protein